MAKQTYHGKFGTVTLAGAGNTRLQSWDLTTTADMADTTAMGATNSWSTQEAGLTDFSANIEFLTTSAADNVANSVSAGALAFGATSDADATSATYITGTGIPTTLTETVSIDDVSRTTISYEGNDATGLTIS